ncbi:MAG: DUF134 domain-containing protein [Candidatus Bipolaricaulaceae bacterium]
MPRPPKPRWCRGVPPQAAFKPAGVPLSELPQVSLGLDELEALRLCDLVGLDQEAAGREMGVSRGTVQRLLTTARAKVADALTNGKALVVTRTNYVRFPPGGGRHRWGAPRA